MYEKIADGKLPTDATAAIWITNCGLESERATLEFVELFEILLNMARFADQLSMLGSKPIDPLPTTNVPTSDAPA